MDEVPDDEQLIARFDAGDSRSFDALVHRFLKRVYRFAYRLVGNHDDAEEVAQEVFLKAWERLHTYRRGDSFRTWIFTIARNAAIDRLRKKRSVPFSAFDDEEGGNVLEDTLDDPEPLPDELAMRAEDGRFIERVLLKVAAPAREILLLHYVEHLTFEAIAQVVGRPLNTVKSQHRRALLSLRELLKKEEWFRHAPKDV